ncbi:MAG TPA: hypothetical protein VF026_11770 [Ktedonobacteraceae bacterium]
MGPGLGRFLLQEVIAGTRRERVRGLAQALRGEPGGGTEVIAGEPPVAAAGRTPIGPATSIAGTGLLRGKMADLVAKREGGGLLQPAEPGDGAHCCHRLAFLLLIGQDHGLDHTGCERGLLHTHLLS